MEGQFLFLIGSVRSEFVARIYIRNSESQRAKYIYIASALALVHVLVFLDISPIAKKRLSKTNSNLRMRYKMQLENDIKWLAVVNVK